MSHESWAFGVALRARNQTKSKKKSNKEDKVITKVTNFFIKQLTWADFIWYLMMFLKSPNGEKLTKNLFRKLSKNLLFIRVCGAGGGYNPLGCALVMKVLRRHPSSELVAASREPSSHQLRWQWIKSPWLSWKKTVCCQLSSGGWIFSKEPRSQRSGVR